MARPKNKKLKKLMSKKQLNKKIRKLEEDNKVLKETLADRSSEVAFLKCIVDEADDLIQEHCSGYYVGQWLNILRSYGYE